MSFHIARNIFTRIRNIHIHQRYLKNQNRKLSWSVQLNESEIEQTVDKNLPDDEILKEYFGATHVGYNSAPYSSEKNSYIVDEFCKSMNKNVEHVENYLKKQLSFTLNPEILENFTFIAQTRKYKLKEISEITFYDISYLITIKPSFIQLKQILITALKAEELSCLIGCPDDSSISIKSQPVTAEFKKNVFRNAKKHIYKIKILMKMENIYFKKKIESEMSKLDHLKQFMKIDYYEKDYIAKINQLLSSKATQLDIIEDSNHDWAKYKR